MTGKAADRGVRAASLKAPRSPRKQADRRAATRALIVDVARRLFVDRGYDAPLEAILETAEISKGALYHHFTSKQHLFAAVFEDVARETLQKAVAKMPARGDPATRLKATLFEWLKLSETPGVATILYDLAPKALGWAEARAIEDRHSLGLMRASIEACGASAAAPSRDATLTAHLLNAAIAEIAMARHMSRGATPGERETRAIISALVDALVGGGSEPPAAALTDRRKQPRR